MITSLLGPRDVLKTSGAVMRNNFGTGQLINRRGTTLGGWLLHEGWMSLWAKRLDHIRVVDGNLAVRTVTHMCGDRGTSVSWCT